jgi:hypothetical protein
MPSIYLAPMAFECTIFIMTAISAWRDAKIMSGPGSAPFLKVLYRGLSHSHLIWKAELIPSSSARWDNLLLCNVQCSDLERLDRESCLLLLARLSS